MNRLWFSLATVLLALSAAAQAPPSGQRIGSFRIGEYGTFHVDSPRKGNIAYVATITGLNGGVVPATSALYDLQAKHIKLTLYRAPSKERPTDMTAQDSVQIVIRENDATGKMVRKTVATCDKAVYKSAGGGAIKGRLRLTGNVHTVTTDPQTFVEPLDHRDKETLFTFLANGDLEWESTSGVITGRPYESAPKGTKP